MWRCQDQLTCAPATLSTDGFWDSQPSCQPAKNISTVVLHLISHMGVLMLLCDETPDLAAHAAAS